MSPGKPTTRKRKSQTRSHNKKTGIPWLVAVWIFENACTDGICLCRHFGSFHSTIGKLIPVAIFVIGGVFFIKWDNFTPLFPCEITASSISTAVITVFYAFTGFENVGVAAGDMENPTKNVPKTLILSMSIVPVIYNLWPELQRCP